MPSRWHSSWQCRVGRSGTILGHRSPGPETLARVPRSYGGNGFDDQCFQNFLVNICELLDVEAALAGGVLAELCDQRLRVAGRGRVIQNGRRFTRRKTDKRHVALSPAVVSVVVASKAYD